MTIRVRLRQRDVSRLTALVLLVTALFALVAWASAREPEQLEQVKPDTRYYYITPTTRFGSEALLACNQGYHFASLWEILDTTNLTYNTDLGQTTLDSGNGPPTIQGLGWVRTGYNSANTTGVAGRANCALWASSSNLSLGSVAGLPNIWTAGSSIMGVWEVGTRTCNFKLGVWCVQDALQFQYLPTLMRE